jgi:hypothetical protein
MISSENAFLLLRGWFERMDKVRASLFLDEGTRCVLTGFIVSLEGSVLTINDGEESGMVVDLSGAKFSYSNDRDFEKAPNRPTDALSDGLSARLKSGLNFFLAVLK